jgi:hypothetical protein
MYIFILSSNDKLLTNLLAQSVSAISTELSASVLTPSQPVWTSWKSIFDKFDKKWKQIIYAINLFFASCAIVLVTHIIQLFKKQKLFEIFIILSLGVLIYYYALKNPLNISKKMATYLLLIICIGLNLLPAFYQECQSKQRN